jgi:hypothetical protein
VTVSVVIDVTVSVVIDVTVSVVIDVTVSVVIDMKVFVHVRVRPGHQAPGIRGLPCERKEKPQQQQLRFVTNGLSPDCRHTQGSTHSVMPCSRAKSQRQRLRMGLGENYCSRDDIPCKSNAGMKPSTQQLYGPIHACK